MLRVCTGVCICATTTCESLCVPRWPPLTVGGKPTEVEGACPNVLPYIVGFMSACVSDARCDRGSTCGPKYFQSSTEEHATIV